MRLHRIELLANTVTVELPFHHQTTVVAGLDRLEAEALALEIVASVDKGRPGLSVDLSTQAGRRLEVKRPLEGAAFAVDVDTGSDATPAMTVAGAVRPLAALGITSPIRVTAADLAVAEQANDRVLRLAGLDQEQLWGLAIALAELEVEVARQTDDEVVGERISPEAANQIEHARSEVEIARQRLERLSDQSILAATSLVLIAFAVAFITHPLVAVPFIFAALAVAWRSWSWHNEHKEAVAAELEVLSRFGLESYLDFQLRKVDALTNNTKQRRSTLRLAEQRRFAIDEWHQFVGADITLDWAATHRPTITAAARQPVAEISDAAAAAAAEAVSLVLASRIREATAHAEPSLLLIDDIFSAQNDATVERLLWLIDHHCQQLQFVLMSSDARVMTWAAQRTVARHASILRLTDNPDDPPVELDVAATATAASDSVQL